MKTAEEYFNQSIKDLWGLPVTKFGCRDLVYFSDIGTVDSMAHMLNINNGNQVEIIQQHLDMTKPWILPKLEKFWKARGKTELDFFNKVLTTGQYSSFGAPRLMWANRSFYGSVKIGGNNLDLYFMNKEMLLDTLTFFRADWATELFQEQIKPFEWFYTVNNVQCERTCIGNDGNKIQSLQSPASRPIDLQLWLASWGTNMLKATFNHNNTKVVQYNSNQAKVTEALLAGLKK